MAKDDFIFGDSGQSGPLTVEQVNESLNPFIDMNKSLNPVASLFGTAELPQSAAAGTSIWDTVACGTDSSDDGD